MKIRVNHNELNQVVNNTFGNHEKLRNEIDAMLADINSLKSVWMGEEADMFYSRIDNYLGNMKAIDETYNTLSNFMSKANKLYREADENFAKDIDNIR